MRCAGLPTLPIDDMPTLLHLHYMRAHQLSRLFHRCLPHLIPAQALGLALAIAACIAGLIKWLAWYFEVGDDELVSKVDEGAVARIKARRAKDTKMETKVD